MTVDIATLGIRVDSVETKLAAIELDRLDESSKKAERSTKNLTTATEVMNKVYRDLAGAFATLGVAKLITESSALYQRYEQLGLILGVVGSNTGNMRSEIDKTVESIKNQGISMIESRQTVLKLMQSNIDLSNASKLARLAQDAATIGNVNSSQALDSMIHGVTSAQVEVLRTIGINVNFEQSYKKLADSLGVATTSLTENQKMQARLNAVLEKAPDITGAYAASMENAGKMMKSTERLTEDLKVSVGGLFDDTAMFAVTAYTESLKTLTGTMDDMKASGDLKDWSQRIAIELAFVADLARTTAGIFLNLGGVVVNQLNNIKNGDFSKMTQTFVDSDNELKKLLGDTTKYQDAVNNRIIQEGMLTEKVTGHNNNLREQNKQTNAVTGATKELTAAKEKLTVEMLRQEASTKATIDLDQEVLRLTESVMTKQERYNKTLEDLNRLKPYISVDTYTRSLEKAQTELHGVTETTKTTTDQVSELWVQAGRNIQSTLANSIFNFFDDGLKGMLKNVISTVGRIAAEFASLKIAQSIGLAGVFGGVSGAASASTGAGGGGSVLSSAANLGSSALNLFKVGGGISQGVSGLFGGGTQAAAESGAMALWGSSGASASIGSSIAAYAGPAIALAAVDQITRMLVGDKQIGGTAGKVLNFVPILGPLINGLFGRGPMKQGMTTLKGVIGSEGFESGALQTRFDAKGGAFRSNKTDFATVDAVTGLATTDNGKLNAYASDLAKTSQDIIGLINETTSQVSKSLYQIGDDLGISTDGLDDFSYTLKLVSKAGKGLTEEQIGQEIAKISDELARSLLPGIDDLSKRGEKATDTLSRLSGEFNALSSGAVNLGVDLDGAREMAQGMSFGLRSSLVELFGGIEAFSSKTQFFAANFLTDAERLLPVQAAVTKSMDELGLSGITTKDQFADLVKSFDKVGGVSADTLNRLLDLAPAFLQVANAAEQAANAAEQAAKSSEEQVTAITQVNSARRSEVQSRRAEQQADQDRINQKEQTRIQSNIDAANREYDRQKALLEMRYDLETKLLSDAKTKSGLITGFIDSLKSSVSQILPQGTSDAFASVRGALKAIAGGESFSSLISPKLTQSADTLRSMDTSYAVSFADAQRQKGSAADLLNQLSMHGETQLDVEHLTLKELENMSQILQRSYEIQLRRAESGRDFDIMTASDPQSTFYKDQANDFFQRQAFIFGNDLVQTNANNQALNNNGLANFSIQTGKPYSGTSAPQSISATESNQSLSAQIAALTEAVLKGNTNTENMAKTLKNVTRGGESLYTVSA